MSWVNLSQPHLALVFLLVRTRGEEEEISEDPRHPALVVTIMEAVEVVSVIGNRLISVGAVAASTEILVAASTETLAADLVVVEVTAEGGVASAIEEVADHTVTGAVEVTEETKSRILVSTFPHLAPDIMLLCLQPFHHLDQRLKKSRLPRI